MAQEWHIYSLEGQLLEPVLWTSLRTVKAQQWITRYTDIARAIALGVSSSASEVAMNSVAIDRLLMPALSETGFCLKSKESKKSKAIKRAS